VYVGVVSLSTGRLFAPQPFHVLARAGEHIAPIIEWHVRGAVIAIEMHVMQRVVNFASTRVNVAIVTDPSSHRAIDDNGQCDDWVHVEGNANETGRIVKGRFDRMHIGAGKCGDVVGFVMERMDLPVKKFADVGQVVGLPRMHGPMNNKKVRNTEVCNREGQDEMKDRFVGQRSNHGNGTIGVPMAHGDLDEGGQDRREHRVEHVVTHLGHGRIFGYDFIFEQLRF